MITYKELRKLIRFKEKDNNEIRFSDYDIRMAVNEVLRYLSISLAEQNSDFLEKIESYNEAEMNASAEEWNLEAEEGEELQELYNFAVNGVELPEDFVLLCNVLRSKDGYKMRPCSGADTPSDDEYKVVGNRIYSGTPAFRLHYRCCLKEVRVEEDKIELPFTFKDAIVKLSCMVLENNGQGDVLAQAVDSAVQNLIPRRRYANARIKMPF